MGTWWGNLLGAALSLALLMTVRTTAVALWRAHRAMTAGIRPPRPPEQRLDLYELAYLHGRAERVVQVALLRMHAGRRLEVRRVSKRSIVLRPLGRGPRDETERTALDLAARAADEEGNVPWPLRAWDDEPAIRALRDRLVLDGLQGDDGHPAGVLRRSPAARRRLEARNRHDTVVRWLPAAAAAGLALAVATDSYLPLLGYPPLLWWAHRVKGRAESAFVGAYGVTAAGRAAMKAAESPEWIRPGEPARLRHLAIDGPKILSARHPLHEPEEPHRTDPPPPDPEPRPEPVVVYEGPGLGGL
ncbi:TIGR04222 domain-containing membrane protein [Streptomyces sp. NPDC090056]|uniref:TIGR04222 domain-containing membrane protein n=1 Tax=Streptomyces sp. NPDC090056 TaxID=3365934 RepID=UPI0037FD511F